jgi:Flp pilus assembly protein TadB
MRFLFRKVLDKKGNADYEAIRKNCRDCVILQIIILLFQGVRVLVVPSLFGVIVLVIIGVCTYVTYWSYLRAKKNAHKAFVEEI